MGSCRTKGVIADVENDIKLLPFLWRKDNVLLCVLTNINLYCNWKIYSFQCHTGRK